MEAKQNTELAMRNMQMELRTALAKIKQVQRIDLLPDIKYKAYVGFVWLKKTFF